MPIDPQPFDFGELQRGQTHNPVYSYTGGTGKSRTNLPRGNRTSSRRYVSAKGSRKLSIREVVFGVADDGAEFDLNSDLDGNGYLPGTQRDIHTPSRMSPFLSFPTRRLTCKRRLDSGSEYHETRTSPR